MSASSGRLVRLCVEISFDLHRDTEDQHEEVIVHSEDKGAVDDLLRAVEHRNDIRKVPYDIGLDLYSFLTYQAFLNCASLQQGYSEHR